MNCRIDFIGDMLSRRLVFLALIFLPLIASRSSAQTPTPTPTPPRAEVIVEIGRTEVRLADAPASVIALDRDAVETAAAQRIDDVLRQVPGFTQFRRSSSRHANPTTQGANLRGLAGSGASRVNVLLDGFSLNDAFGGWTYWSRVPTIAVEQAEVLRGGASAFYGDQGLSGAVNLRSSRFSGEPIVRVDLSAGTQKTLNGQFFGAYGRGKWSGDMSFEQFQTAGYIPTSEAERGIIDTRAGSRFRNTILRLQRDFGRGQRIFLGGQLFTERRDNGTSLTNNGTYFRRIFGGVDANGLQLRGFLDKQIYDQNFSAIGANRATETLTRVQRVPSQSFGASAFWSRPIDQSNVFSVMAEFRDVRGFSDELGFAAGRITVRTGSGGRQRTIGLFAQNIWQVSKRVNLTAAVRVDRWVNDAALSSALGSSVSTIVFPDRREFAFSPRAALLARLTENLTFVASYARSFRAPTLNELYRGFRVGNINTLANEDLRSEKADAIEAGLRQTALGGRLNLRGTGFWARVSDPVVSVTLATTPTLIVRQRQNLGNTRAAGVEVDAEYAFSENFRITAGYLFTDTKAGNGRENPQAARNSVTFQALWRPFAKLTTSLQFRASGRQFEDDLNSLTLRRYTTADAFASYRFKKMSVYLAIENVLNTRFDIGRTPNLNVAAPRSARIGLRFERK